jgi:signal transduction histidine kinase
MVPVRLRTQLLALMVAFLAIFSGISLATRLIRVHADRSLAHSFRADLLNMTELFRMQENLRRIDLVTEEYLITGNREWITERNGLLDVVNKKYSDLTAWREEEEIPFFHAFGQQLESYLRDESAMIQKRDNNLLSQEEIHEFVTGKEHVDDLISLLSDMGGAVAADLQQQREAAASRVGYAWIIMIVGGFLTAIAALALISRAVVCPVEDLTTAAARWKLGDPWSVLSAPKNMELRTLFGAFQDMSARCNQQFRQLVSARDDLDRFASIASHDLQAPLRTVKSFSDLLERRLGGSLDGECRDFLRYISSGVRQMQHLIADLLSYARAGSNPHHFAPCESEDLLKEVLFSLGALIEETGGKVMADQPLPRVFGDAMQIRQLLQNAISNGLKYRKLHPPVAPVVRVSAKPRDGGECLFSITDNGIGIEPQYLDSVFDMFHRLHSQEEYTGTGLGLAICKRIVERHGGKIWIESTPNVGTTLSFTLPAAVPARALQLVPAAAAA